MSFQFLFGIQKSNEKRRVARKSRLLSYNYRKSILTVSLQPKPHLPGMYSWRRLSRVSTIPGRAWIIPRTWLARPCTELGYKRLWVNYQEAPPMSSKFWVVRWAVLERASYKCSISLASIPSGRC